MPDALPDLRETILRRVDLLADDTRRVLASGSVIGRTFDLSILSDMTRIDPEVLAATLREAVDAEVLLDDGGGRFTFSHALVQDTLYGGLGATRRVRLHHHAAQAIAAHDPAAVAAIAHHRCCALPVGDRDEAVACAHRAGLEAAHRGAHEQAVEHLERALTAARGDHGCCLDPTTETRLLLDLGDAALKAGATARAHDVYVEAAARARAGGDAVLLAEAAIGIGGGVDESVGFQLGSVPDELLDALLDARAALPPDEDTWYALVVARLAAARYDMGELVQAQALSEDALDRARASGDPRAIAVALAVRHTSLSCPNALADRLALDEELRALDAPVSLQAHLWRVGDLLECGRLDDADAEIDWLAESDLARNQPRTLWYVTHYRAMRALLDGRLDDAQRLAEEAGRFGNRLGARTVGAGVALQTFFVARERHELDGVPELLDAVAAANPSQPGFVVAAAFARTETGRFDEARAQLTQLAANDFAVLARNGVWLAGVWTLAEICAALGARDEASFLYREVLPYRDHFVVVSRLLVVHGSVEHTLGLLALAAGALDDAEGHLARAREAHVGLGAPLLVARTDLARARVLAARGDSRAARALLEELRDEADAHGWADLAADAAALL